MATDTGLIWDIANKAPGAQPPPSAAPPTDALTWDIPGTAPKSPAPLGVAVSPESYFIPHSLGRRLIPGVTTRTVQGQDYDYEGAQKAGEKPDPTTGHMTDKYKMPPHITFSNESIYSKQGQEGGKWKQEGGKWHFYASPYNLMQHSAAELQNYFRTQEPDSVLHLPGHAPSMVSTLTRAPKGLPMPSPEEIGIRPEDYPGHEPTTGRTKYRDYVTPLSQKEPQGQAPPGPEFVTTPPSSAKDRELALYPSTFYAAESWHPSIKQTTEAVRDISKPLMGAAIVTGAIFNPVDTAVGLFTFMGMDELVNVAVAKIKKEPYRFQGGKGIAELLGAEGLSKDAIDFGQFVVEGIAAGGATKAGRGILGNIVSSIRGTKAKVEFLNDAVKTAKIEGISPDEAAYKKRLAEIRGVEEKRATAREQAAQIGMEETRGREAAERHLAAREAQGAVAAEKEADVIKGRMLTLARPTGEPKRTGVLQIAPEKGADTSAAIRAQRQAIFDKQRFDRMMRTPRWLWAPGDRAFYDEMVEGKPEIEVVGGRTQKAPSQIDTEHIPRSAGTRTPPTETPPLEPPAGGLQWDVPERTPTVQTVKEAKPKAFQTHVREYGWVDPDKWVAAGFDLEDLPLGMRKKGGRGPDEFTEMEGTVIPHSPEGVYSHEHFYNQVIRSARKEAVTYDQIDKISTDAILKEGAEYERRGLEEEARRRIQSEVETAGAKEVDRLSDEEVIRTATEDPDFVREEDLLKTPEEKKSEQPLRSPELFDTSKTFALAGDQAVKESTFKPPEVKGERLIESERQGIDQLAERLKKGGTFSGESGRVSLDLLAPGLQTAKEVTTDVGKLVFNMFYPEKGASKESAKALYEYKGQVDRELATAEIRLNELERRLSTLSEPDFVNYIDKIRTGRADELTGNMKDFHEIANVMSNAMWDKVVELDPTMEAHRRENHALMTLHWLTDPEAQKLDPGRLFDARNLEGTKQFLRKRSELTASEIIAQGKKLPSHNPVQILMRNLNDEAKFVYSGELVRDAIDQDRWKYLPKGEPVPEGYAPLNDKIATVHKRLLFPEELEGKEYVDKAVYDGLMKVADNLGITPERRPKIGGKRLGYASRTGETVTKSATDLGVLGHEVGHQLDFKYDLWNRIVREVEGIGKKGEVTKTASAKQRGVMQGELRAIADITGGPKYKTHSKVEKIAQMVEAYVHAPDVMKEVAPEVYKAFDGFIREHPETASLAKIRQGLQYQELQYGIKVPKPVFVKSWNVVDAQDKVIKQFPQKEMAQTWADEYGGTLKPQVGFPVSAEAGRWVLPTSEARMLNNYLSRDMIRGNTLGQFAVNAKGWWTGIELISGFHYSTIAQETLSTRLSLGLQQALRGDFEGLARNISSPSSSLWLGHMAKEYMKDPEGWLADPKNHAKMEGYFGKDAPKMEALVDAYFKGGGLTHQDPSLRWGRDKMPSGLDIFREGKKEGDPVKLTIGGMKVPFDVAKFITRDLLFEKIIPNVKFSNFALQYAYNLKQYAHQIERGQLTTDEIARRTVQSIENRLGEMNWENFWLNKSWKTALQLLFRSYTWQAGTWRGFGTAAKRIPEQINFTYQAIKHGERPPIDQDVTWVVGLVAAHVAEAALLGYGAAAITGRPELKPQSWFDYIYPKIGLMTRVSIPGYVKEPISLAQSIKKDPWHIPMSYVESKLSGFISKLGELRKNKDFHGNAIFDPDAPVGEQLKDIAKHMMVKPFSLTSYQAEREQGGGAAQAALSAIGIQKAPSWIGKSKAETLTQSLTRHGEEGRPKEAAAYSQLKNRIVGLLRENKPIPLDLQSQWRKLPEARRNEIYDTAELTPLQAGFKRLPLDSKMKVWAVATPEERRQLEEIYHESFERKADTLDDEDYEKLVRKYRAAER
jgi:hypothetical protein